MQGRLEQLKQILNIKEMELRKAPKGKIHVVNSGKRIQYYLRTDSKDKSGKYMSKKDTKQIRDYLQKAYDEKIIKCVYREIDILEKFVNQYKKSCTKIRQTYATYPEVMKGLVIPIDYSDEDYINKWQTVPFTKNPYISKNVEYKTERGEIVRSKSELNIANTLSKYHIPYKYECPVTLKNGGTVYPDFTILAMKSRKEIYWEHRGMMDDREYLKNTVKKMKQYTKNNIIVGINLILTEESLESPLGTDEIEAVIKGILEL